MLAKCIRKIRDGSNVIREYILLDENGKTNSFSRDELVYKMQSGELIVINLKIDKNGRLVDKAPDENKKSQPVRTEASKDIAYYKEILRQISELKEQVAINQKNIDRVVKHSHSLQSDAHNNILSQISLLNFPVEPDQTVENKLDSIYEQLISNADSIEELGKQISTIGNNFQSIASYSSDGNTNASLISSTGIIEKPTTPYEEQCFLTCFTEQCTSVSDLDTNAKISEYLSSVDETLGNSEITVELLNDLIFEVEDTYKVFNDTKSFYETQLSDYYTCMQFGNMSGLLADVFVSKLAGTTKITADIASKAVKELSGGVMSNIPLMYKTGDSLKTAAEFKRKPKLSNEQAKRIFTETSGMWNCAAEFLSQDYWEIALFTIQMLNKLYFNTYIAGNSNLRNTAGNLYNTFAGESGEVVRSRDTTFSNKKANSLTEKSLQPIFNIYKKQYDIDILENQYYEQVCERFIVSYFAAKKVCYKYRKYPFGNITTPEINGAVVNLVYTAMLFMNIRKEVANSLVRAFCSANNAGRDYKYKVNRNINIKHILES